VEIRDCKTDGGKLILSGVANAMPCTVEMGGLEMRRMLAMLLHPKRLVAVIALFFSKNPDTK
jgi:hypothetical protein